MCSIMGYCSRSAVLSRFMEGFQKTISRGPDDSRVVETGDGILGFHRLAIMGLTPAGMQPFRLGNSYVVCNGEIYGFEKLKKALSEKYTFESDSDCEILLPMYQEYGTDMFAMLDAEFACIIYDGETGEFIAARDPIGIRPLYYGYDENDAIVFASEKRLIADAKVGFLLSGGLDSSLVCAIAAKKSREPIKTFAIGMSEDAIDLKYAKQVADYIGSDHTEVYMTPDEVLASLETVIQLLGTYDITTIRASIGMYLVCKAIHNQTDIRVLLTGEISDELFGYKYTDFAPDAEAFQKESQKRIRELHMYDVLRADRCISVNSLEARVPFGDLDFVKYVMAVNPELKMNTYGKGKYLLRHAFEQGGYLPDTILWREKAAFSDAVGHSMVDYLKEYAESKYTDEEFESRCRRYTHARPFTKESLLYREIFEIYYPGQSEMVADFWMPNREWEGCNVTDPSARVLSNYGDSGK